MFKKNNPEARAQLEQLHPQQTYTREQIIKIMAVIAGVVIDGEPMKEFRLAEETARWFKVELVLDSYLDEKYDAVEHWYFFKAIDKTP